MVPGGHGAYVDDPAEFAGALRPFLRGVSGRFSTAENGEQIQPKEPAR